MELIRRRLRGSNHFVSVNWQPDSRLNFVARSGAFRLRLKAPYGSPRHATTETALPDVVLIAGANGAGKTTFARRLLQHAHPGAAFLNADEIQRIDPAFAAPAAAGRELLLRLDSLVAQPASFAIETTLSSLMYARRIPGWKAAGFTVSIYFLEVASADFAVARVARRVAAGGHDIPEADIRRRHARGLALFPTYRALADAWYHYRVNQKGPVIVAHKKP